MNQKQLINQLKSLKEIKPRENWVVLLKSQILTESQEKVINASARKANILETISLIFAPKRLAYSFAVIMFLIVGVFGFARYTVPGDLFFPIKKIAEQSQAALTGQIGVKQEAAVLSRRINDLAQVAKAGRVENIPSAISEVNANVSALTKNLEDTFIEDPQVLKEIAVSLKTLASVPGADLTENQNVVNLYQMIIVNQILDLKKSTLTEDQQKILAEAEELYNNASYIEALEKILLINQ